jgi:branched-chain amino acid aminotransferase
MPEVWLNGEFVEESSARIDPRDGGLLHAAGVFTTTIARGGKLFAIDAHLRRLRDSSQKLYIPLLQDNATLADACRELLVRNDLPDARVRITVTRGQSTVSERDGETHAPTTLITAGPRSDYPGEFYDKGMTVLVNSEQKANPYDIQAGHKTLDYLSRFAALREAARRGAGESLWFNVHNFLQSGSISNVFLVEETPAESDGELQLVTPPTNTDLTDEKIRKSCPYPKSTVLPGIMRDHVIAAALDDGVPVQRLPIDINRLLAAREVFVTNSAMGVMPVTRVEQQTIGDGSPGELTRRLMTAVENLIANA